MKKKKKKQAHLTIKQIKPLCKKKKTQPLAEKNIAKNKHAKKKIQTKIFANKKTKLIAKT